MTLGARVKGIIRRPRKTFEGVMAAPTWLGLMATMVAASTLSGTLLFQSEVGRLALVDQWERTAIAFGQQVDDARYEQLQSLSDRWVVYSAAIALLNGPVLVLGIAGLLFVFVRNGPRRTSFRQILAVVTHSSVILTLRQVVAAPVAYARETTSSATSLGVWFPVFDESSPIARVLGAFDLFVVWWLVVLAIGTSVLYQRAARPLTWSFLGAYMGMAIVMAIAMTVLGGTS